MKEVLYKSRFLVICLFLSLIGWFIAPAPISLIFFIFIVYSGGTIAKRMDDFEEEKKDN